MDIEQAIKELERGNKNIKEIQENGDFGCVDIETWEKYQRRYERNELCIEALREKQERENPKPLSLEELMQRKGKPVFYKPDGREGWWTVFSSMNDEPRVVYFSNHYLLKAKYGVNVRCYDHEPKESKNQ